MKNKTKKSVDKLPVKSEKKTQIKPNRVELKKVNVTKYKSDIITPKVNKSKIDETESLDYVICGNIPESKEVVNPITIRDEAVISSFTEKGLKGFGMTKFPKSKPETNDIALLLQDLNNYNYSFELHSRGEGEAPLSREDFYASLSNKYNVTLK